VSEPGVVRSTASPLRLGTWLLAIWSLGFLVMLSRFVLALRTVRRLVRRADPVTSGDWRSSLAEAEARMGCHRGVGLFESTAVKSPIVVGFLRPAILLPVDAAGWQADRREAVLLHELAHVRRLDCLVQAVAETACTIHWFNPLAWIAVSQLRTERERATDDLVLGTGTKPSAYAGHLIELARNTLSTDRAPASALSVAEPSDLGTRVARILDRQRDHSPLRWGFAGLVLAAALGIYAPLGLLTTTPALATAPPAVTTPQATGPVQVLTVAGLNHPDDRSLYDGTWWAVCPQGSETRLKSVAVELKTPFQAAPPPEGEGRDGLRIAVPECPQAVGLIRNLPGLSERSLSGARIEQSGKGVHHRATALFTDGEWQLRGEPYKPSNSVALEADSYQLVVRSPGGVEARFEDAGAVWDWELLWAGDLDGDGRIDLIVQNGSQTPSLRLFVSSGVKNGGLLRWVADSWVGGC
jgi:beta-lactamase regulating signal transducer with metallopeptidase domain